MATTVTLRLSNNAHTFNAEKSTGFAIRGGVKYYDRDSKKDEWTNYEAVVFASSPAQHRSKDGVRIFSKGYPILSTEMLFEENIDCHKYRMGNP